MSSFDVASALNLPDLPKHLERVDKQLRIVARGSGILQQAISRLLQARGKRLRASLVIATATVRDRAVDDNVILACTAVELVHIASLVHDDIIDEADTRWNIPTINSEEGSDLAIVAGDYLFAKACELAASISSEAGQLIAQTITQLCIGQARELADAHNTERSIGSYYQAIEGKTAALFSASCRLGCLLAKLSEGEIEALTNFGKNFGMAFQIIDDVLDFTSTPEQSGKPTGNDLREGVYTLPLLLALQKSRSTYETLIKQNDPPKLTAKLKADSFIAQAIVEAGNHSHAAMQSIDGLKNTYAYLSRFPEVYVAWSLNNYQ